MDGVGIVRALWAHFQARDWAAARALLHDDAAMHWLSSGEHFDDADAIVQVQRIYPEGWTIRVIAVDEMKNGDVLSVVEVSHPPLRFIANSRFQIEAGRIRRISETWATVEAPPAWRTAEAIGAYRREPLESGA
jgi:hypothetical protein